MKRGLVALAVVFSTTVSIASCTVNITVPPPEGQERMGSEMSSSFTEIEMFAEMMIPHHQQAIDMANLALDKDSVSPELKNLSQRIIDGQTPEIALMEGWLDGADRQGVGGMMSSGGEMMMGGMASEEEMAHLATLDGSDFEAEFLALMITHHEGALRMVHMIQGSSFDEAAKLARDIVRVQTAEIEEMKIMLERDSGA